MHIFFGFFLKRIKILNMVKMLFGKLRGHLCQRGGQRLVDNPSTNLRNKEPTQADHKQETKAKQK